MALVDTWNLLPGFFRRPIARIVTRRLLDDRASYDRFWEVKDGTTTSDGEVEVALRALDGGSLRIRRDTSDATVLLEVFAGRYHLPPPLPTPPMCIWDLGSNIGLTMAHFATLFPEARIFGIEMDVDNARLCRQNVSEWKDRCRVIEAAVASDDGTAWYSIRAGKESQRRVVANEEQGHRSTEARSLNSLFLENDITSVDYMKVDIEGTEKEILRRNTEWCAQVTCIKVEVHQAYTAEECADDLAHVGFSVARDKRHSSYVIGQRS